MLAAVVRNSNSGTHCTGRCLKSICKKIDLVNETIIPSTQQPGVLYRRLSDLLNLLDMKYKPRKERAKLAAVVETATAHRAMSQVYLQEDRLAFFSIWA